MAVKRFTDEQELEFMEKAMRDLGWTPNTPSGQEPKIAALSARLSEMYGGPGDGRTLSARRTKVLEAFANGRRESDEPAATVVELPPNINGIIVRTAEAVSVTFKQMGCDLAATLEQNRIEMEHTSVARVAAATAVLTGKIENLEGEVAAFADLLNKLDEERTRLIDELDQAKSATGAAEARQLDAQQAQINAEQTTNDLAGQLTAEQAALSIERTKRADLEKRLNELELALSAATKTADKAIGSLESKDAELIQKARRISELEASLMTTTEKAAKAAGRIESVEAELVDKARRISELEASLTTTTEKAAKAAGRIESVEAELVEKARRISELEGALAVTTEKVAKATGRIEEMQKQHEAALQVARATPKADNKGNYNHL